MWIWGYLFLLFFFFSGKQSTFKYLHILRTMHHALRTHDQWFSIILVAINTNNTFGIWKTVNKTVVIMTAVAIEVKPAAFIKMNWRDSWPEFQSYLFFLLTFLNLSVCTEVLRLMLKRWRYRNFSFIVSFPIITVHY